MTQLQELIVRQEARIELLKKMIGRTRSKGDRLMLRVHLSEARIGLLEMQRVENPRLELEVA